MSPDEIKTLARNVMSDKPADEEPSSGGRISTPEAALEAMTITAAKNGGYSVSSSSRKKSKANDEGITEHTTHIFQNEGALLEHLHDRFGKKT